MRLAIAAVGPAAALVVGVAAAASSSSHAVPSGFHPQTAAAAGTRDYWVLGYHHCGTGECPALLRSTDAGKHFFLVGLPTLSAQGDNPSLTFVNARLGYLVSSAGRLYVTHDGGTSWHHGGADHVREVVAGGGEVYVLARNRLERSSTAKSSWQVVALPIRLRFLVSVAVRGRRVWLLGSTRHIRAGDVTLRSADHGTKFAESHGPCIPGLAGRFVPAGRGVVWAVCPTGMMAALSVSTNGGRTFPVHRSFHDPGGLRLPALTNGAGIFPSSAHAAVLSRGASGPLFRTTDLGRRWTSVPKTARIAQVFWLDFATRRIAAGIFATRSRPKGSFWRTTDGGATWHFVPIH